MRRSTPHLPSEPRPSDAILNHPPVDVNQRFSFLQERKYSPPTPESVFASDTFFKYAITGPLWDASMTSLEPEVRVWRQVSFAVVPAWTLMTVEVDWGVPLGAPLQAMEEEETSWTGYRVLDRVDSVRGREGRTPS